MNRTSGFWLQEVTRRAPTGADEPTITTLPSTILRSRPAGANDPAFISWLIDRALRAMGANDLHGTMSSLNGHVSRHWRG
jgi:hypothetical protein